MSNDIFKEALAYHTANGVYGKVGISLKKPCNNQRDLSLAYTPGIGGVSREVHQHPETVWEYTNRSNLVAVISDGTAVLGLGDIGPEAALPVMEGKAVLFKVFADIDSYPLCLNALKDKNGKTDPDNLISVLKTLEPSFGGINLEDIAAPACFHIQERLDEIMEIPVFHDDQDGTAIITLAGLYNALDITGKKLKNLKVVINGAGAAGISTARLFHAAGMEKGQLFLCDRRGLITTQRTELTKEKQEFMQDLKNQPLQEVIKGADLFIGVSAAGALPLEMAKMMNKDAIIFAVANPVPEIMPDVAVEAGAKVIGTGRSDFHNQVNNVLGFPGIFRGALDTRALTITLAMKIAAAEALREITNEPVEGEIEEILKRAYPEDSERGLFSGKNPVKPEYVIPKPFDPRVVPRVARRVAEEAMKSGIGTKALGNLELYEEGVAERVAMVKQ